MVDLKFTLGSTMYFEVVKVKYRELGRTGLKVSEIGLVTLNGFYNHCRK